MQITQSNQVILTKQQTEEISKFKADLQNGVVDIAFEGSLFEGKAYLNGLAEIVEVTNHS